MLDWPEQIETLTVFFAGHGGVKAGTFYLLPRDASSRLLSATALSASELLSIIAEAAPLQTNLIVDACQAGGVSGDIRALLRPEDLGAKNTPGVTVLAMAARDQSAMEVDDAGIGTFAFLNCIEGKTFVSDNRPTLDLLEIGTRVAEVLAAAGEQSPVLWGLNLFGPRRFCRNPSFGGGGGPLRATLGDWLDSDTQVAVEAAMSDLWRIWDRLDNAEWSPREVIDGLGRVLATLPTGNSRAQLLERLNAAGKLKADSSLDRLRTLDVTASIIVAALRHAGEAAVAASIKSLATEAANEAERVVAEATIAVCADRYALLTRAGGIPDLFLLPLRLTRLLGWAAMVYHIRSENDEVADCDLLRRYINAILEQLPSSVVAISDAQAAPLVCALSAAFQGGATAEAEMLLGTLFNSAIRYKGLFASPSIDPKEILRFLIARQTGVADQVRPSLARPTELLTILLRGAALFGLEDAFDPWLIQFDGTDLNAFLPAAYEEFGDDTIRGGVNAGYRIGTDIFTVSELEAVWQSAPTPIKGEGLIAVFAALLLPDRTPWFLMPKQLPYSAKSVL
ncbi:hypothetical protein [Sphingomonas qomolangmaensis]|uniref:Caspase family protein n=1 Tax=Sphingomonas qomolangmaensis TaxID=2918765 RepID=A0ABY5LGX6_9SPHN|nr:hypothetical protein [Sphingomonas qomolangmaensis]UUL83986.1 hypothetical protein NMP03_07285 [Sphingomonas qomolangmaensis]